jgi:hypothetical protein
LALLREKELVRREVELKRVYIGVGKILTVKFATKFERRPILTSTPPVYNPDGGIV